MKRKKEGGDTSLVYSCEHQKFMRMTRVTLKTTQEIYCDTLHAFERNRQSHRDSHLVKICNKINNGNTCNNK